MAVRDMHYKDIRAAIMAVSDALNAELTELVDAGCSVIQMEETQIHLLAAKGLASLAPLAGNGDDAGRARNRRVELVAQ